MKLRAFALLLFSVLLAGCYDHPLYTRAVRGPQYLAARRLGTQGRKRPGLPRKDRPAYRRQRLRSVSSRADEVAREKKVWESEGWISRIGYSRFLTLKCNTSSGEVPEGAFVFVNYQVIDQNTVVIRPLELDSPPESRSQELRAEVRRKLKEGSPAGGGGGMEKSIRSLLGARIHRRATLSNRFAFRRHSQSCL